MAQSIRLFASDLDGTLVGNPEATRHFARVWQALPATRRPLLVYNSGRLVEEVLDVCASAGAANVVFANYQTDL